MQSKEKILSKLYDECDDLKTKIDRLQTFVDSVSEEEMDTLYGGQQQLELMMKQALAMLRYYLLLCARIQLIEKSK